MQNKVRQIISFMKELEKVCLVKRDILLSDGQTETDACHIFKLSFLIMLVYPYLKHKYDYAKLLEMALVHDIAEGKAGDVPLSQQLANPQLKEIKKQKEEFAIQEYTKSLPSPVGEHIYELFEEYEKRETAEAKLVYALDKLEANLQANFYNDGDIRYWRDCIDGDEYYKMAKKKKPSVAELQEEIISDLENAIFELCDQNMQKWNICV